MSGKVDVNHDGISDLIIESPYATANSRTNAGTTTVIFGKKTWKEEIDTLTDINGTNGFKLLGENSGDQSGNSVSSAGDVNSDGIQDFIIGAYCWNKSNTMTQVGRSYVVIGKEGGGWPAMMNLSTIDGKQWIVFTRNRTKFQGAGDVNNDGKDDLTIGAPFSTSGIAYVVYGQPPIQCPMKTYLSGNGTCKNCTLGIGCLACSGIGGTCTLCNNTSGIIGSVCAPCGHGQYSNPPGTLCVNFQLGFGCTECSQTDGTCINCMAGMGHIVRFATKEHGAQEGKQQHAMHV